jgi:putative copper export protein
VRLTFSENLNAGTSRAVVVDTANRQVDDKNSAVNAANAHEMDVGLPLLKAGTYVVAWRAQSADDGHITSGSFIFRIARPDGSVPPLPAKLPTGNFPGAGGSNAGTVDGPAIAQAIATWLALLLMTLWVGGLCWETWILAPGSTHDADLSAAAARAARRFRRLAPWLLALILVADVGIILAQGAELAGDWSGLFAPPLLRAILFGSRFGTFWWMRQIVAAAALLLVLAATRNGWQTRQAPDAAAAADAPAAASESDTANAIPDWRREVLAVFRSVPALPARFARGWQRLRWLGRLKLALGAALLVAFALSGHASAVPATQFGYAIGVDLLHLVCEAAWIGGILYISLVLLPATGGLAPVQRARLLARGLPQFSAVAIVGAFVLAATGSLNTTIHLTSVQQFLTTAYGRILAVKIELFLIIVAISAFHAFVLRPRLARLLAAEAAKTVPSAEKRQASALVSAGGTPATAAAAHDAREASAPGRHPVEQTTFSPVARRLSERLEDWLQREALLGAAVLLCVALLGAYAGSLTPAVPANAAPTTANGPFIKTEQASGYSITLKVVPATFGTNTFTVTVRDAQGKAMDGAAVLIATDMLDMDMGVQSVQLKPLGPDAPGSYSGQGDLTMAGHWDALVKVLPPKSTQFIQADFRFSASY